MIWSGGSNSVEKHAMESLGPVERKSNRHAHILRRRNSIADSYTPLSRSPFVENKRSEPPTVNLEYIVVFRLARQGLRPTNFRCHSIVNVIVVLLLAVKSRYSTRPFVVAAHKVVTYALHRWSVFSKAWLQRLNGRSAHLTRFKLDPPDRLSIRNSKVRVQSRVSDYRCECVPVLVRQPLTESNGSACRLNDSGAPCLLFGDICVTYQMPSETLPELGKHGSTPVPV